MKAIKEYFQFAKKYNWVRKMN